MTSPHESDGRFYGYNQDPYTRDPYRDPYTGDDPALARPVDERDLSTTSAASTSSTQAFLHDANHSRRARRERATSALPPLVYLGGVLATATIAGLGAWLAVTLGVIVADNLNESVVTRLDPAGAALRPSAADSVNAVAALWMAVVATAGGGVLAWVMRLLLPMAMMFFRVLGFLALCTVFVLVATSAHWTQIIPCGAALLFVGPIVVGLLAKMSEHIGRDHRGTT